MTTNTDKLVMMARAAGFQTGRYGTGRVYVLDSDGIDITDELAAFRAAIIADLTADVEPVAWGIFANNGNIRFWVCNKASANLQAAKIGADAVALYPASTVAALKARVAELKEAAADTLEKSPCDCPHKMRQERGEHLSGCHLFDLNAALTKGQQ